MCVIFPTAFHFVNLEVVKRRRYIRWCFSVVEFDSLPVCVHTAGWWRLLTATSAPRKGKCVDQATAGLSEIQYHQSKALLFVHNIVRNCALWCVFIALWFCWWCYLYFDLGLSSAAVTIIHPNKCIEIY